MLGGVPEQWLMLHPGSGGGRDPGWSTTNHQPGAVTMPEYDFILDEKRRNWENRETYGRLMRRGLGCQQGTIVFSHHLIFHPGEGKPPQEIPAADSLIFNPDIMRQAFGPLAGPQIAAHLATLSLDARDQQLRRYLDDTEVGARL
jgi:hypothetical protein